MKSLAMYKCFIFFIFILFFPMFIFAIVPLNIDKGSQSNLPLNIDKNSQSIALQSLIQKIQEEKVNVMILEHSFLGSIVPMFDFKFGGNSGWGYAFIKNPWNNKTIVGRHKVAADIRSITDFITIDKWKNGINIIILGFDEVGNVILDINKKIPAKFLLYFFDEKGNVLQNVPIVVPVENAYPVFLYEDKLLVVKKSIEVKAFNKTNELNNEPVVISVGINGQDITASNTIFYPFVLKLKIPNLVNTSLGMDVADLKNYNNYLDLKHLFKKIFLKDLESIVWKNIDSKKTSENYPKYLGISFGKKMGFMFFSNAWGNQYPALVSHKIKKHLNNVDWSLGISFLLLALDANNKVIVDITKTEPASFYMVIYESSSGDLLNTFSISLNEASKTPYFIDTTWTNEMKIEAANYEGAVTTYPCLFTIVK